jgi:hypothetical protein
VVVVILGVVKLLVPDPLANTVPPVEAAYQSTVIPLGVLALMTTVPGPHLDPAVPAVGVAGCALMVATKEVRVDDTHVVPIRDSA